MAFRGKLDSLTSAEVGKPNSSFGISKIFSKTLYVKLEKSKGTVRIKAESFSC